jgi:hypothetical protein
MFVRIIIISLVGVAKKSIYLFKNKYVNQTFLFLIFTCEFMALFPAVHYSPREVAKGASMGCGVCLGSLLSPFAPS